MRDYYEIGTTPIDEPCAATGEEDYSRRARMECRALINHLYRQLPHDAADFIELRTKAHGHDFGTYYEVVAYFDDEDERAESLAMQAGDELPYRWDDEARTELMAAGYFTAQPSQITA